MTSVSGYTSTRRNGQRPRVWTVDRSGTCLTCAAVGNGPAVLIVQGIGMSGVGWHPQMSELAHRFDVVAFTNRGVDGDPPINERTLSVEVMARDALAVMDARGIDRFHVVGTSTGGLVALEMALLAPHRVRSLSLLSTFASGAHATELTRSIAGMRTRIGTRRMRRHAALDLLVSRAMRRKAPRELLAEYMRLVLGRDLVDLRGLFDGQLRALAGYDPLAPSASSRLVRLAGIPTLVVTGAEDRIAPPAAGKALAAAIPWAHYLEIPEAAHGMAIQYARVVNRLLAEHFLAADRPRLLLAAS